MVLGLATWRISALLRRERGPWGILQRFRALWGIDHDEDGEPRSYPDTEAGRILQCLRCISIWIGGGLVGFYLAMPEVALAAALPFAVSALAILVEGISDG